MMQATILLTLVTVVFANGQKVDPCGEPLKIGPCTALKQRFFYNSTSLQCEQFGWGGCQPNGNNFRSLKMCERSCIKGGRGCLCEGVWYPNQAVISDDPCMGCQCDDGFAACYVVDCAPPPCGDNAVTIPGQCCPTCPEGGCEYEGVWYPNQAVISDDPCMPCQCDNGFAACAVVDCFFPPPCPVPVYLPGQCCPVCPEGSVPCPLVNEPAPGFVCNTTDYACSTSDPSTCPQDQICCTLPCGTACY